MQQASSRLQYRTWYTWGSLRRASSVSPSATTTPSVEKNVENQLASDEAGISFTPKTEVHRKLNCKYS
ncbi:hypothetical protein ACP_2421 [Acidobacterium capsulatum ATCC 51196]|uniref:Uncharacterized protein n=1 Tax=Acidobacterium capsulatum (strain ATCC 51196 / DSM 11244 / BCRC 80197 / JCM 7670 / NBRC 15755 / NCIMB 13165 / 161) TaxID=240015 RepID=C1F1B6_ACIC5|nr:hypothetical protein ACP_2421 [Acidobacterium capsulatum ATCC 51196]